jgi:hypothetical protein
MAVEAPTADAAMEVPRPLEAGGSVQRRAIAPRVGKFDQNLNGT